ncbi:MAG: thermonuclease family protein [Tsuneonella sp.]
MAAISFWIGGGRRNAVQIMIGPLALACASCAPSLPPAEPLNASCTVTDGDTLRCGAERIRLLAIDAPEKPGSCRPGRECAPGDPFASKAALEAAIAGRSLTIARAGKDQYGRTLAVVYADRVSTSCTQLHGGHAIYVRKWDRNGAVDRECRID